MTTSPKAPAKTLAKKSPQTDAAAEPSLRFHHSKALRTKTTQVLDALDAAPTQPQHAEALADLVAELVDVGMDYYFLRALQRAEVGFLTEQSARLGLSGASKLINSVSRKFIVRMDATQLQVVASHIRDLA
ncbi:MAG: hypothetical protein A3F78_05785 [Burkholderiales bacterium RIFCSPLOWO2_12_FULL_61_40]|nr:MAG: hypothetical protein A3F78_05785 [Burkholderiales bacterium RIFCSPLOWO2_12_FULL_61_40]